jgi:membrane-bound lytic murein transglycosylase B
VRLTVAVLVLILALAGPAAAGSASEPEARALRNGWGYLLDRLAADGVPRARAAEALGDPRVPPFDGLSFSLVPREARGPYRQLQNAASVRAARECRARHAEAFAAAEQREGVPASLVAAIIHVESACGRTTGASLVLYRLARLAMANEPLNLARNLRRHLSETSDPQVADVVQRRGRYLEDTFYPEVRGLFTMTERLGVDMLAMHGSPAGAFGYPQFLPTSYLRFGVDGNGDGRISLYDMADAAASCARYLAQHGWKADIGLDDKRSVLWHYNRSEAYIETILVLERQLHVAAVRPQVARER